MSLKLSLRLKAVPALLALAFALPVAAQDRLSVALAQYQNEGDPTRKARNLAKLGDYQVDLALKQLKSGEDVASLDTLKQYVTEAQQTVLALKGTGVDAERKPSGFKELQISLRQIVRRIDDMVLTLPVDKRPFFREVRSDLVKTQSDLIDALFPRRPDADSKKTGP